VTSSIQSLLVPIFFANMAIMLGVGGRLLWTASRTRRAPEACIGASAAFGALGVILSLTATSILNRSPDAFPLWAAGRTASAVGICALAIGWWRIYRPAEPWAAACSAVMCAISLTGTAIRTSPGTIPPPGAGSLGFLITAAAAMAVYAAAGGEALSYHRQLERRLPLGLADPVVSHQFFLWAVSGACAFASIAVSTFFAFVLRTPLSAIPVVFILMNLALLYAAVCLWFAFFPPGFYRRWLTVRAFA
jgi:hypothetical protein